MSLPEKIKYEGKTVFTECCQSEAMKLTIGGKNVGYCIDCKCEPEGLYYISSVKSNELISLNLVN